MSHLSPLERAQGISEAIRARRGDFFDPLLILGVLEGRRSHPELMALVTAVLAEKPQEAGHGR